MNPALLPTLAGLATLALAAQDRLVPGSLSGDTAAAESLDSALWSQRLTSADLERREDAFEELLERAACDEEAAAWLRSLADSGDDLELAWTARLALRLLACEGDAPARSRAPRALRPELLPFGGDPSEVLEELGEIERRIERLLGEGAPGPDRLFGGFGVGTLPEGLRIHGGERGVQVESSPDGVRIRVESLADGEREVEVYEGPTLEAILEANPGLEDELGLEAQAQARALSPKTGAAELFPRGFALRLRDDRLPGDVRAVTRTDVLGVRLTPVTDARAGAFGLEPGTGLLVEEVVHGTIARALGLRPGDVLLEIDGRRLQELDDVSAAIQARRDGSGLTVTWLDRAGRRLARTWTPLEEAEAPEASDDGGGDGSRSPAAAPDRGD